jgi:hypothetical protein
MRVRILATMSLGLLSAACQGTYSQNAPGASAPAYGNTYQSSNAACADYGFRSGTASFNQCVAREQQARASGRVNRDYAATQLTADARNACSSYGLDAGTASYGRCVSREIDARTYRDGTAQPGPAYYTDQNGNRVDAQGYRVDTNGHRMTSQPSSYYPSATLTYPSQPAPTYRMDQYNNRVDAQGYHVDSTGRRMPVQGLYYTPDPQGSSTQAASRDEIGNRYDAQGNRVDANRVIATPQYRY